MKIKSQLIFFLLTLTGLPLSAQFKIMQSNKPDAYYLSLRKTDSINSQLIKDSLIKGMAACRSQYGDIYIAGLSFGNIIFKQSYDRGVTWYNISKTVAKTKKIWNYQVHGCVTNGLPSILCDTGRGPNRDRIYISWGDEKYGTGNKDVFIAYSDDRGENWTEPVLVTYRPNHKEQFKPSMALNQENGNLYLLYFDSQNYVDTGYTDLYLALSFNGGLKFDYYKINKQPICLKAGAMPDNKICLTEKNEVKIFWEEFKNGKVKIYNSVIIDAKNLLKYNANYLKMELKSEKTFQFADTVLIDFTLTSKSLVSASITKPIEPGFEKLVLKNKAFKKGNNQLKLNTKQLGLEKGNYILSFYYKGINSYVWITE